MMNKKKCPKCGAIAERDYPKDIKSTSTIIWRWRCGTMHYESPKMEFPYLDESMQCRFRQIADRDEQIEQYQEYADRMNPVLDKLSALLSPEQTGADDDLIREAITELKRLRRKVY